MYLTLPYPGKYPYPISQCALWKFFLDWGMGVLLQGDRGMVAKSVSDGVGLPESWMMAFFPTNSMLQNRRRRLQPRKRVI